MSLLNPGGYRGPVFYSGKVDNRVFTDAAIARVCNQGLKARDHAKIASTSIATGNRNLTRIRHAAHAHLSLHPPHEHKREISRRQRQEARAA